MPNTNTSRKRSNGQGSIHYNKKKKLWVAQYIVDDKRKTVYAKTKIEVREKLVKAQGMVLNGLYFDPTRISLEEWLKIWFEEYMIGKRAPKTIESHANNITNHIVPAIGKMKLKDLKGYTVQKFYNELGNKYSPRTVHLVHVTLNSAIKQAIMNDLILTNAASKCVLPRHSPKKSRSLTRDEQKQLISLIKGHRFELVFLLCLYAGLRRGEALSLQWKDIDFDNMQININKTASRVKSINPSYGEKKTRIIVKDPKTKTSNRVVPISSAIMPFLKAHRKQMFERRLLMGSGFNKKDYLFTNQSGQLFDGGHISNAFHKLTKDVFSSPATVHTLRHTFVTRGAESGVSMKVMQELCGHSKIDITADIYTHISSEFKHKEFAKMNTIL